MGFCSFPVPSTVFGIQSVLNAFVWNLLLKRRAMEMLKWKKQPDLRHKEVSSRLLTLDEKMRIRQIVKSGSWQTKRHASSLHKSKQNFH